MRLACDTGGTFTDLVVDDDDGRVHMFKAPTTPADPPIGILDAVAVAAEALGMTVADLLARTESFIHGTTHAINAIITGKTARTAFLTTQGHPDILVIREGGRIEPFNFAVPYPKPYIPRALTHEISGRILADGTIQSVLDEDAVKLVIARLVEQRVEAVAVCLLWSTINPAHERRVGALLDAHLPGIPYTLSHRLNPVLREYRRAASTAIDASLKPLMSRYLGGLATRLAEAGFGGRLLMLTSQGGVMDYRKLAEAPVHAIGSGPSMAPVAGRFFVGDDLGRDTAIIADTGGTTYDVSLVRGGRIPMTPEVWIGERYRGDLVGFPSVDVKSVGAGGGSIASVDAGGLLHVGPGSAGAVPGPVCYGRTGTRPTVTDAALALGYLDPTYFLGGRMTLDLAGARAAIARDVADPLGLSIEDGAAAVMALVTENMVSAIEDITVHQGVDPRGTVLIGGGGAAGLNSTAIGRRLGCSHVLIPELGATLSAAGALISELHADFRALRFTSTDRFDYAGVNEMLGRLGEQAAGFISEVGDAAISASVEYLAEARYASQIWEIELSLETGRFDGPDDVIAARASFDAAHEKIFSYRDPGSAVEFVGWRAVARCSIGRTSLGRPVAHEGDKDRQSYRRAYFKGTGWVDARVERFETLGSDAIAGPAIVESPFTTVVIDPGASAARSSGGSLIIIPGKAV